MSTKLCDIFVHMCKYAGVWARRPGWCRGGCAASPRRGLKPLRTQSRPGPSPARRRPQGGAARGSTGSSSSARAWEPQKKCKLSFPSQGCMCQCDMHKNEFIPDWNEFIPHKTFKRHNSPFFLSIAAAAWNFKLCFLILSLHKNFYFDFYFAFILILQTIAAA